jgi:hypothetical protein
MIGALGLSFDLGRMYITKNEAQAYTDSAALAAALQLDGTAAGFSDAKNVVNASTNRWNLGSNFFSGTLVEFAQAVGGPWSENPAVATDYTFVRVTASSNVPAYFMPVVGASKLNTVRAQSVAGQIEKTGFREGSFPFSPLAHDPADTVNFGLTVGEHYTLRWAANPKVNKNTCPGDNANTWINQAEAGGGSERGYIEENSSSVIRQAIKYDYQILFREVGDSVVMTGGAKSTQGDAIQDRIAQDSDPNAINYASYLANGTGNGRRIILVPINTYHPNYTIVGYRAFFLLRANNYNGGGNDPFCAEYIGPWVQGSKKKGAGSAGAYVVRLVS